MSNPQAAKTPTSSVDIRMTPGSPGELRSSERLKPFGERAAMFPFGLSDHEGAD